MVDFYQLLGVSEDATEQQIKQAYRKAVFAHHPDTNPEAGRAELKRFHEIQEAYRVLRDPAKRAQYDSMRAAGFGGEGFDEAAPGGGGGATPWGQPSVDERDFDARFDEWWKKMSQEFQDFEERQYARQRMSAERMASAAAWEWEKAEAQKNKVRAQRLKHRTEDARMTRHASVLRRLWQTHSGFTLGDALVAGLFLAGTAGLALTWRAHLAEARHAHQARQQPEDQPQPQPQQLPPQQLAQQQQVRPPGLPAAAAAVAAAATQPT